MAVTNIPNVQNWTVTPQNGQSGYFDLMNTWLGQSTLVIASLQSAITAQNLANAEINTLASQAESNAIIATGLANYQGEYSTLTTYSKSQSISVGGLYYTSKVNGNSNHAVTDTNYWVANPINDKATTAYVKSVIKKRKNYLINGNFQFWDYGTSQTVADYASDNRWLNYHMGSTKEHLRMTLGDTERTLFESPYYSRTVVSSVAGINNYVNKLQFMEDVTKLAGKTVTLSFWAKADTTKSIALKVVQDFGTGGPYSDYVWSNQQAINLTAAWQKKTIILNIPSIIGKTLGTDGLHTSYTRLDFEYDLGTALAYAGVGQQSGVFDIAEVKLEDGSSATDGWAAYDGEWGAEATARMRYYEKVTASVNGLVYTVNGDYRGQKDSFKVTKRVTPITTLSSTAVSGFALGSSGSGVNLTGNIAAFVSTVTGFRVTNIGNYANISSSVGGGDFMYSCSDVVEVYLNSELGAI